MREKYFRINIKTSEKLNKNMSSVTLISARFSEQWLEFSQNKTFIFFQDWIIYPAFGFAVYS